MTASCDEPRKSKTLATLVDLVCKSATPPTPTQMSRGLRAVSELLAVKRVQRRAVLRLWLAGLMATACVAGVFGIVSFSRGRRVPVVLPPLAYQTEGGTVIEGGYLRESGREGIRLSFSEGTQFALMPGTHGRLRSVDSAGARIAIDNGTAMFQVTPRKDARWLVEAGPFLVTVNGTVFTVSWDISSERFELTLRRGRVTVSGPVSGGDIALRAGQRLVVNLPRSETLITEENPEEVLAQPHADLPAAPNEYSPNERPSTGPRKPARRGGSESPAVRATVDVAAQSRWAEAVASSDWDRILRDAESTGVKSVLEEASSEDLFAFADAARYRRRMALAREALLAQRRRFPNSPRSLDVAYLLGRVEESSARGMAGALRWYDEYLARAPSGTYASEALGRKMILTGKLRGRAEARMLADEYLRRFPNGAYAGSARALRPNP